MSGTRLTERFKKINKKALAEVVLGGGSWRVSSIKRFLIHFRIPLRRHTKARKKWRACFCAFFLPVFYRILPERFTGIRRGLTRAFHRILPERFTEFYRSVSPNSAGVSKIAPPYSGDFRISRRAVQNSSRGEGVPASKAAYAPPPNPTTGSVEGFRGAV